MRRDYKVTLRTEESLAAATLRWRERADIDLCDRIDIIDFIERICRTDLPGKGMPALILFDGEVGATRAYVKYRPTRLYVEAETWDFARQGDPESIYVLAHEIGHIVLHDHHAKAFAEGPVDYTLHGLEDWSAEWQANTFADYLLLPDHVLARPDSIDELVTNCGVLRSLGRVDEVAAVDVFGIPERNQI